MPQNVVHHRDRLRFWVAWVLAIIAAWLLVRWLGAAFPQIVAAGERPNGPNYSLGYSVGKYRWRPGLRIELWADSRVRMCFNIAGEELVCVKVQRWLANDRAILLELSCIHHDSMRSPHELALLYDFERGELHSSGSYYGWLVPPPPGNNRRAASREEFETAIRQLSEARPLSDKRSKDAVAGD